MNTKCDKCGGDNVELNLGLRIPPWCPDCKSQLKK